MKLRIETSPEHAGVRVDQLLAQNTEVGSRSAAQRLIGDGHVQVDGATCAKSHRLRGGELVEVEVAGVGLSPAPSAAASVPAVPFAVAWEDEHLMVVDKPAGLVVHPAPGHAEGTLSQALAARGAAGGEAWRPGIVHRLDKDTSGLLVVAKSDPVLRKLQEALAGREVERVYMALVRGRPASRSGTVDAPLARDRGDRKRVAVGAGGRDAVTHFDTVEELAQATLLRLRLETGRTHQIRVHLAGIGLPVCGDVSYGEPGAYGLGRQFLHACELAFKHPVTGEEMRFESPLPEDLKLALHSARTEHSR